MNILHIAFLVAFIIVIITVIRMLMGYGKTGIFNTKNVMFAFILIIGVLVVLTILFPS
jgi:hypothetical protein